MDSLQTNTYPRTLEVESSNVSLKIFQCTVGDVGCVVWDAGIALSKYLDHRSKQSSTFLQKKAVLELGAGTGIVGLVAAACGANAHLTDLPEIVPILNFNIEANECLLRGTATAGVLKWGLSLNENIPKPDMLFVSDCVYYEESIEPLVHTIKYMSTFDTEIYVAYEDRDLGNKLKMQLKFMEISRKYFVIHELKEKDFHPDYYSTDIHILKMKKLKPI